MENTLWITLDEAAERLRVSTRTIRRMIAADLLEAQRFGPRLIRVNSVSLMKAGRPV